jgi:hypothetical protein
VLVSHNTIDPRQLPDLLAAQAAYTPAQKRMAIESPHLFYVVRRKGLPQSLRNEIFERDGPDCAYCGTLLTKDGFTVDHIRPVAMGGSDDPENLTVACRPCNSSKGAAWDGDE